MCNIARAQDVAHTPICLFSSETVDCFVRDLRKALIKDLQKKIIESVAFVHFEEWWTDQDKKYKDKVSLAAVVAQW